MFTLVLSALLFIAGLYLGISWLYLQKKCTEPVEARVAEISQLKPGRLRGESRHYYPCYSYKYGGKPYSVYRSEPSRTNQWKVGDRVKLYINPKKPEMYREKGNPSDLIYAAAAIFLGTITLLAHFIK